MGCNMCEKPKVTNKKGLWSPDEDQKLKDYILKHGHGCWTAVALRAGLQRNGKSCRLRWMNYLRPGLKRCAFTAEEESTVMKLHAVMGNKWSQIAMHLPGRTDNEVKNHWNTYLRKKLPKVDNRKPNRVPDENKSPIPVSESNQQLPLPKLLFADWIPIFGDNGSSNLEGGGTSHVRTESSSNSQVLSPELSQPDGVLGWQDSGICGGLQPVEQISDVNFHDLFALTEEAYTHFEFNQALLF
ncbi:transcription factor LAF1-like [Zingiber officinale]|uniref:MYB protein n=1 Tax=Zingiber officinale TaxID=94328 RepID=A0A8J5L064_ZINOF|nr:transcription factor LAF1-like [Zingiber officinale]KAG6505969.1 hypothetical protein ZIOFF_031282 [Zingiber officinale]WLQ69542.1 MYB protein [Zingiber officinale]